MSYCPLPWINLSIGPGEVAPCCWSEDMFEPMQDPLHSNEFKEIRRKMLADEKVSGCAQCYKLERLGLRSRRLEAIDQYGNKELPIKLRRIDWAFDNICNLKCRGCNSFCSHSWNADEIKLYGASINDEKVLINQVEVDLSAIEHIELSGGEPLLSPRFSPFFDKIRNRLEEIDLSIVTNGTVKLDQPYIDDFLRCKRFDLAISIDGGKDTHNYFRSGNVFDQIIENLDFYYNSFKHSNSVTMQIITTINVYNIHELDKVNDIFKKYPKLSWQTKLLDYPDMLNIKNLPSDYKKIIRPIVETYSLPHVLEHLDEPGDDLFNEFIKYHTSLDDIRKETLPHSVLSEYIDALHR